MKTAFGALILWIALSAMALADMEISPLRHVLSSDNRSVEISISNPSTRVLDGRISWIDLTATPSGYSSASTKARDQHSAAPYLVVSPADFRLEPGAKIIISVKLKDGLAPPKGERRSHLLFKTSAARTPLRKASDNGLQVDLGLSVSIPIILRNAKRARARLGETKLLRDEDGTLSLQTAIEPTGDISPYGRLSASFVAEGKNRSEKSTPQLLGVRENVAAYLDAPHRIVDIPLGHDTLGHGELILSYEGTAEFTGQQFDQRKFDIAPPKAVLEH